MNWVIVCAVAPMVLNFNLLSNRKSSWVRNRYKWITISILFVVGLFSFLQLHHPTDNNLYFAFWGLMTPLIFSLIDYAFMRLSFTAYGRDYYLWLRDSSEIDNPNIKFKALDKFISITMLLIVMTLPIFAVAIIKN